MSHRRVICQSDRRRPPRRRGAFTVVVLVCLLISTMILLSLLKIVLLHDRQLGREGVRVQAVWLAEAGLERAADRLAADSAFSGETWKIEASRLGGRDPATVTIRIDSVESQPHHRLVVVEAVYPAEGPEQARITRQTTVTLIQEQ
jgi:Tfp pilus assembly protein PilX